ncbi:ATP-dependent nuclease [Vibrio campbellii]|uniref:Uncharacterized protein n=1 Tax=Vibrio campbellii (strain ATCC BAA-1116) TaxID=2902295 RepID=A7N6N8_VIBC1|nr:AAA family ATPase [Vibrio campbellii]ABU74095.1 hypothetical protein VIBHAR_06203 [Vibrio campbellii ATCC BAA-1116]AGU98418.1 exonuclease [Vibrio campbellii ATCC BAA-1116]MBT0124359.1 AAA family ATPase [Vibrio campbellii]MBT0139297.1 AAA family ATPase [Vibrio campbellii]MBT0143984.1 AAA family ATPase [Vibrio campbellii]
MKLSKVRISNFQCFGKLTEIEFEEDLTALIGLNGSGKTSTLHALSRMFGVTESSRKVLVDDFHCPSSNTFRAEKLFIEAWFEFPELQGGDDLTAVASTFNQMCFSSEGNGKTEGGVKTLLRVRLEAELTVDDVSPEGIVNETVYFILSDKDDFDASEKRVLRRSDRNNIQVHYIPASRNPFKEISSSTKILLGRLLDAIQWSKGPEGELQKAVEYTEKASDEISKNAAVSLIQGHLENSWDQMYAGDLFSKAKLNFLPLQSEDLLKTISLSFESASGAVASMERLSDGQRSLLHISIIQAVHEMESKTLQDMENRRHFDQKRLKRPIYTMLALEEPENHLAPHYLGRIVKSMVKLAKKTNAQVAVTTHSPSLVGRIEPKQIRHFRQEKQSHTTIVSKIDLPSPEDEQYKFVSGAVKAYPEIYFARLVVLGEGESEQIVIPKLLSHCGVDIDDSFISVAPLGGRHVNHFWRLLEGLNIPYVTLLDLDYGRHGGGWGRVKYVLEQQELLGKEPEIRPHNNFDDPLCNPMTSTYEINDEDKTALEILGEQGVFFSTPLDLDYSMQVAFPEQYNVRHAGERGPRPKAWDDLKPVVLKSSYSKAIAESFYSAEKDELPFNWYSYRFLGSKGKPVSHIRALEEIDFESGENKDKIPESFQEMIKHIIREVSSLPE